MLKIYLFNVEGDPIVNETHGSGIIAETQEEAVCIYQKRCTDETNYTVEEWPIKRGLIIGAYGHDFIGISAMM